MARGKVNPGISPCQDNRHYATAKHSAEEAIIPDDGIDAIDEVAKRPFRRWASSLRSTMLAVQDFWIRARLLTLSIFGGKEKIEGSAWIPY